jgi:integrase
MPLVPRRSSRIDKGPVTLQDVLELLTRVEGLSNTRRRDLASAVKRVASHQLVLDIASISARLAAISPAAAGLSSKSLSNVRSNFVAAVRASRLKPVQGPSKRPISPAWSTLVSSFSHKRDRIGLGRLARFATHKGIAPDEIDDGLIDQFIAEVRAESLHRNPNSLHRMVTRLWNGIALQRGGDLRLVTVPSFRPPIRRMDWTSLPQSFRDEVEEYLVWCGQSDPYAADARKRALKPQTLKLRRNEIHAAVTALLESGVEAPLITSLADLCEPEYFKRILRRRDELVGRRENSFNAYLARALVSIAREWLDLDDHVLSELKRLAGKVPSPPLPGLTAKNKRFLRQFDDPSVLRRLYDLPARLWSEIKKNESFNQRTLAQAQAAIAVSILCYMPIRMQNLIELKFDVHVFLREGSRAISSLELSADEVKNRMDVAFDIPAHLAKMLLEYRNKIAPKIIGHRPQRLFVTVDGRPKSDATLASQIRSCLKRRAGIEISAHQFRHLSAKTVLDAEPGNFETVRQLLGHKSLRMTVGAYAGIDSRRAARHHQRLVDETLKT